MKCNICHKEFGEGVSCQHCGVDRVTALGNYQGYSPNAKAKDIDSNKVQSVGITPKEFEVCYACSEVIPAGSEYCPCCGKKLFENCPKCGKKYSSRYAICPHCGTNRIDYIAQIEKIRQAKIKKARFLAEKKREDELRQAKINEEQKKIRREQQRKAAIMERGIEYRIQSINTKNRLNLSESEIREESGMESKIAEEIVTRLLKEADSEGQVKATVGCIAHAIITGILIIVSGCMAKSNDDGFQNIGMFLFFPSCVLLISVFYKILTFTGFEKSEKEENVMWKKIESYKRLNPNDPISKYLTPELSDLK